MNILIIGASSGLGMALSEFYSQKKNSQLISISSDISELVKVKNNIKIRFNKNITIFQCDISNKLQIDSISKKILKKFNHKIDLVYYAAGIIEPIGNLDLKLSSFERLLNINFLAFHLFIQQLYKYINKNFFISQIIYISSISTIRVRKNNFLYSSSKKISDYYIDGLNQNLRLNNLNILIVYAGYMNTRLAQNIPNFLKLKPIVICEKIHKNLNKNNKTIYIPSYWFFLSIFIKFIPKSIWNAIKF